MAGVQLTKNEQKKQKDSLKQFRRYLPTLQLKKQQLQVVIRQSEAEIMELREQQKKAIAGIGEWIAVYGENADWASSRSIRNLISVKEIKKSKGNIAGVEVPIFDSLVFEDISYDLREYPLWVDLGLVALR
ncbi:MAG: V-type ATP synthase subunit D, partial [Spirochaetales bacterium]|nr:V-type ATP synthase subunit D [Candidatus Physcosoma equi]